MSKLEQPKKQGVRKEIKEPLAIYVDGSSSGNPGWGGVGVVIKDGSGEAIAHINRPLGRVTNNVAEYEALITGLKEAQRLGAKEIKIYLDSELVVKQIMGEYRVCNTTLRNLEGEARRLLGYFPKWDIIHITREENKEADRLARKATQKRRDQVIAGPSECGGSEESPSSRGQDGR